MKSHTGFQMLCKEAQKKLMKYEHTVICLMVLVATSSIIWSIAIHILSGDFYNGIIGAKFVFRERDFTQMDASTKEILYQDLGKLINETYTDAALESVMKSNEISKDMLIMPEHHTDSQTTKKPKARKIAHLFQISSNRNVPEENAADNDEPEVINTTAVPKKVKFDAEKDRKFLASMTIDIHQTRWRHSASVQFIYSFPFLSEIIAIIWTAMCLIFQSGVKKYWGLPKPWRIVLPSILMFTLMSVGSIIYTILANGFLKTLCTDLRENLSNPYAISCGQAISVLRPLIREHEFQHDVYLNLFRVSYTLTLVLWLLALLVMVVRYIFAVDFQLVDVLPPTSEPKKPTAKHNESEFTDVLLNTPQQRQQPKLLHVDERHRSEDDFQSAKSHLSEVATPLLEHGQLKEV